MPSSIAAQGTAYTGVYAKAISLPAAILLVDWRRNVASIKIHFRVLTGLVLRPKI